MKKSFFVIVFLFFLCSTAWARLQTKVIEYKQGDAILEGYLAYDDILAGKRPGVLVVHEWMGVNDYVKMRADMLAELGYVAFAADIYGQGIRPRSVAEATAESSKYKNDRALLRARARAALEILREQPNVDPARLGAIGYCFGGTTVLELARSGADIKGVVSFHGGLSTPAPQDARNIKARVLVLHGADDPFVPEQEVRAFIREMKEARVRYSLIQYPKAVHGFTNPANSGELRGALYHEAADRKSWKRMEVFLRRIFK